MIDNIPASQEMLQVVLPMAIAEFEKKLPELEAIGIKRENFSKADFIRLTIPTFHMWLGKFYSYALVLDIIDSSIKIKAVIKMADKKARIR